jgi:exodeoxyribonuclease-3
MNKMRIISWNLAGMRAAVKKGLWNFVRKDRADIYCFQEVKALPEQVPQLECPKNYLKYWNPAKRAGYSGVATLSKLEPKIVIVGDRDNDWDDEGRVLITKFDEFTLLNVYFPNGKRDKSRLNYKMEFYEYFLKYINKLRGKGEKVIFCGDVNTAHEEIDLARPRENENVSGFLEVERDWIDLLVKNGWVDTYRLINGDKVQYSWWSQRGGARKRNVGWRIDYFFTDEILKDRVRKAFILPEVSGSDHCPVGIEIGI